MFLVVFYTSCFLFPCESLRVLQWNAGGLRARSTKLLHFISSHLIDLICIQESLTHLPLSGSLDSVLCDLSLCDRAHSHSGILSPDTTHASGGVIIFVRQGLSLSELSTSSLSSFDSYSDYVSYVLNNSFLLSFLNVYACSNHSFTMEEPIPFSFYSSLLQKSFHSEAL